MMTDALAYIEQLEEEKEGKSDERKTEMPRMRG